MECNCVCPPALSSGISFWALVYNEGRRAIFDTDGRQVTSMFDGRKDRSLQLKLTYSFDY